MTRQVAVRGPPASGLLAAGLGLACLIGAPAAASGRPAPTAGDVEIRVGDCRAPVVLNAREARLSEVFARLAQSLRFELRLEGGPDPVLNLSRSAPASELVAGLAAEHGSFMIRHAADPRCPGRQRVAVVWLTPKGTGPAAAASAAGAGSPATARAPAVPVTETATRERLREVEAEARRRKLAYEIHVRKYGKPPEPEPEEAAQP